MKLSEELQISVNLSMTEAARRSHEFVAVEHLLFALLHDPATAEVITACGGNTAELIEELEVFLEESVEKLADPDEFYRPVPSLDSNGFFNGRWPMYPVQGKSRSSDTTSSWPCTPSRNRGRCTIWKARKSPVGCGQLYLPWSQQGRRREVLGRRRACRGG